MKKDSFGEKHAKTLACEINIGITHKAVKKPINTEAETWTETKIRIPTIVSLVPSS